jgi:two-component system, chemotaxis family, sensor kinase CheA
MDQTHDELLAGLEEHVQEIYNDLDALRDAGPAGPLSRALIDRLFRRVHSVKGSASSFGLNALSQIAHEFEGLLHAARTGRVPIAGPVLATCESAADALAESLGLAAAGVVEPSRTHLFEQLQAVSKDVARDPDADELLAQVPPEISNALTDPEKHQLTSCLSEGVHLFMVSSTFDLANFDEKFFKLKEKLAEWGEVISTFPSLENSPPDTINFRVLYAARVGAEELGAKLKPVATVQLEPIEIQGQSAPGQKLSRQKRPLTLAPSRFVRTDLDTLDRLISSTHQLFRQTTGALDSALVRAADGSESKELAAQNAGIKSAFLNVEDELINLRMVSLAAILQRAVRAGRSAARLAGKEVDFEVAGSNLRLDKLLADAFADPLVHLIRNAVDHGIESRQARTAAGKSRRGVIRIDATTEGGRSRVRVSDDGRGIDPKIISTAARRLGLIDSETDLDLDRSVRFIFRPGFTTVEAVSELSGRGVGLDVVETAIEQAGGELRVSSTPGDGATFEIRLPVTFGIMEAQIVESSGQRYCIALSQISVPGSSNQNSDSSTQATDPDSGPSSHSQEGRPAPADLQQISMRELLGQPPLVTQTVSLRSDQSQNLPSLLCCFTDEGEVITSKQISITVDKILGTEKILVRSLGRHAGRWYGVAGATELNDGSIALVLDLPRLVSTQP